MKKIFLAAALIMCLTGCSLFNKESKYDKPIDISYKECMEKIEKDETFTLLLWQTGCSHCETFEPKLNEVIKDYDLKIYSINLANLSEIEYAKIKNKTFINGTPTTVYINKGVVENKLIGDKSEKIVIEFFKKNGYIGD